MTTMTCDVCGRSGYVPPEEQVESICRECQDEIERLEWAARIQQEEADDVQLDASAEAQ